MEEVMIDKATLRKLQLTQKEILDEIVRVCNKNELTYYLAYGTLLGAVRHNGFIPWDDDLDIWMKREDYEKFVMIAPKELGDEYYFIDANTSKKYGLMFGKVVKKRTIYKEKNAPKDLDCGIFVDIFPLDTYGAVAVNNKRLTLKYFKLKRMLLAKCGYRAAKTLRARIIMSVVKVQSLFYSKNKLLEKIKREEKEITSTGSECCSSIADSAVTKVVFKTLKSEWFDDVADLEFEGTLYKCPKGYDNVLREWFGDYMQLPPENQRYGHHGIINIDFNCKK